MIGKKAKIKQVKDDCSKSLKLSAIASSELEKLVESKH